MGPACEWRFLRMIGRKVMSTKKSRVAAHLIAGTIGAGLLSAAVLWPVASAQSASNNAIPDFMQNELGWRNRGGTHFHKIPGDPGPGPIVNHPDYVYEHGDVNRVADTSNPILQPWAKRLMDKANAKVMDGGIPFVPTSRCWPAGVPGLHVYPAAVVYLQTPDVVYILNGRNEMRRIYMNVPHSSLLTDSWYGESVGHYENGDTLVIDTIGLDDKGPIDRYRTPHTKQMHVVERHTLTSDGNLDVSFTVDDPGAFTQPWNAHIVYNPMGRDVWNEYVCAEGELDQILPVGVAVPIPSADMADF